MRGNRVIQLSVAGVVVLGVAVIIVVALLKRNAGSGPTVEEMRSCEYRVSGDAKLPDLCIERAALPESAASGKPLTYAVTVRNVGTAPANKVALTEFFQNAVLLRVDTPTGYHEALTQDKIRVHLDAVPPEGKVTVSITVQPFVEGPFALVSSVQGQEEDLNKVNNELVTRSMKIIAQQ